jgi:hypothetical protein
MASGPNLNLIQGKSQPFQQAANQTRGDSATHNNCLSRFRLIA